MMKPKFSAGDKVFAKVRGYPPWPARVEGLADETPNKMRYHIYFYGTGETAVVKAEDICSFVENKVRLGKPKKHKNFTEALLQIEDELSTEEQETLNKLEEESKNQSGVANDSAGEDSSKRLSNASKAKTSLSPTPKSKTKEKKRKIDYDSGSEDLDKKRSSTVSNSDSEAVPRASEVLSRSGRKIKPKRFADFEDENTEDPPASRPINKVTPLKKSDKESDEFILASVLGGKVKIPLSLNKPNFKEVDDEEEWEENVKNHGNLLKKRLESGDILPASVESNMNAYTKELAQKYLEKFPKDKDNRKNDHLRIEAALLELDLNIRSSLSIKNPDPEKCIDLLDKLKKLNLTALMLKKHPDVVTTIKKVRRYIGNQQTTIEADQKFQKDAETIRSKADHIYSKFQALFVVPSNKSFWEVFDDERLDFEEKIKTMSPDDVINMFEEPKSAG